jgi:hypothetical protein
MLIRPACFTFYCYQNHIVVLSKIPLKWILSSTCCLCLCVASLSLADEDKTVSTVDVVGHRRRRYMPNEVFRECGTVCERVCGRRININCVTKCVPEFQCRGGYARSSAEPHAPCVSVEQCRECARMHICFSITAHFQVLCHISKCDKNERTNVCGARASWRLATTVTVRAFARPSVIQCQRAFVSTGMCPTFEPADAVAQLSAVCNTHAVSTFLRRTECL